MADKKGNDEDLPRPPPTVYPTGVAGTSDYKAVVEPPRRSDSPKVSALKMGKDEDTDSVDAVKTRSPKMKELIAELSVFAKSPYSILLKGETGTGKSTLARVIHDNSSASSGKLVSINCSSVPHNLFESEFFGHKKGAFTDAKADKNGLLKEANGGTLFLDEIGDMPLEMQAKLLTVLDSGEFRPVGATKTEKSNFRLICASHKDLEQLVKDGKFREDLYFRISPHEAEVPSLRERPEDIPDLADTIFNRIAQENPGLSLTPLTKKVIEQFTEEIDTKKGERLGGNIRSLQKMVLTHAFSGAIKSARENIPDASHNTQSSGDPALDSLADALIARGFTQQEVKGALVHAAMRAEDGNRSAAADRLGIGRSTFYRILRELENKTSEDDPNPAP